jgi:hypothetical protein
MSDRAPDWRPPPDRFAAEGGVGRSPWSGLVAVAFVLGLAAPGVAEVAGLRPLEVRAEPAASLPALSLTSLLEPETFPAVDVALARNLPGRDQAIRAYAVLRYRLLHGSTSPLVVVGRGSWVFFRDEIKPYCPLTADQLLAQIDRAAAATGGAGVAFRFTIAPDKIAIYPDQLMETPSTPERCTDRQRGALRAGMAARTGSTVDLWARILAHARTAAEPIYFDEDTHWTPTGALDAARSLVDSLDAQVWSDDEITVDGTVMYSMDLTRVLGDPQKVPIPRYVIRPAMTVTRTTIPTTVHLRREPDIEVYTSEGPGTVFPGTTLVIGDSFFDRGHARPLIVPWFAKTIWVHIGDLFANPELAADLPPIDTIIVERAERYAYAIDLDAVIGAVLAARARVP